MVAIIKAMVPWDLTMYSAGTIVSEETVPSIFKIEISSILKTEAAAASSEPLCMYYAVSCSWIP
jgi:hypothetical protein